MGRHLGRRRRSVAVVMTVAALVEDGGTGADSAGPIADAFLRQL
jgi:hypothetical protein